MTLSAILVLAAGLPNWSPAEMQEPVNAAKLRSAIVALGKADVFAKPVAIELWGGASYVRVWRNTQELADVVFRADGLPVVTVHGHSNGRNTVSSRSKAAVAALLFRFQHGPYADAYIISCDAVNLSGQPGYSVFAEPAFLRNCELVVPCSAGMDSVFVDKNFVVMGYSGPFREKWVAKGLAAERKRLHK